MNKVFLSGNVGKDPDFRTLESGSQVLMFSIAINENYKDKNGEWVDKTQWFNIVVWGKSAEYLSKKIFKGYKVLVEGKMSNRKYQAKDGSEKQVTDVIGLKVEVFTKQAQGFDESNYNPPAEEAKEKGENLSLAEDDLPF